MPKTIPLNADYGRRRLRGEAGQQNVKKVRILVRQRVRKLREATRTEKILDAEQAEMRNRIAFLNRASYQQEMSFPGPIDSDRVAFRMAGSRSENH